MLKLHKGYFTLHIKFLPGNITVLITLCNMLNLTPNKSRI